MKVGDMEKVLGELYIFSRGGEGRYKGLGKLENYSGPPKKNSLDQRQDLE